MAQPYVYDLKQTPPASIGNKAEKLRFLAQKGFPHPPTHVCTWDAYLRYQENDPEIVTQLKTELSHKLNPRRRYAVRSSANLEDNFDFSFAGQFKSVLNVQGVNAILEAVWSIWATAQSAGVRSYLEKNGIAPGDLRMAVIFQEMVQPSVSGVSFSKNPMTGLDEIVVEAVRGSGEALVQEGATPHRWINKWGAWISEPESSEIERDLIHQVVQQTKRIARAYDRPVDLEWIYDGQSIHWVQLREITSLDVNVYANHIAKEVFPGLIKPLVWSVNVPLVNGAWVRLFTELIGPNDIDPLDLARSFYYRAYFNMGAIGQIFEMMGMPRETLELLMGIEIGGPEKPTFRPTARTYTLLPRMLRVALGKLRFTRKLSAFLPVARRQYQTFRADQIEQRSASALLGQIDRLFDLTQETAYYNIVTPLLMQIYNRLLQMQLARSGVDLDRFDLTQGLEALEQFDPNAHLTRLNQQYRRFAKSRASLAASSYDEFRRLAGAQTMVQQVDDFIAHFGHLSDSGNDFSAVPWREDPDLVLKMVVHHTPPQERPQARIGFQDLPIAALRKLLLRPIYRRARRYRLEREAVSFVYTFGYGLFRDYFLALGDHLVTGGIIRSRQDIFYLYFDEVRHVVDNGLELDDDYQARIEQRKREMSACQDITPPSVIYGDEALPIERQSANKLKGTATSRGHYTGRAKMVRGIRDFDKLEQGDVLVIPFSDVGWTPLFTKAGAVIAESGGMLSHSSIVAREYNIPAVVSVPGACRLADGTRVTVDGYRGTITVHATEPEPSGN